MANKGKDRQCIYEADPGSIYCGLCSCRVDGCTGLGCETYGTRRKWRHMWQPYPAPLKAVLLLGPSLVKMEPVDLTEFLEQSAKFSDILLLALLADVWEPMACRVLASEFKALKADYSAADLAACFDHSFEALSRGGASSEATANDSE